MTRPLFAALLLIAALATAPAAPVPVVPPDPTKDREGNPLPKGATARLGSLAFRGPTLNGLTFSPDGQTLRAAAGWYVLAWDADTGRPLPWKKLTPKGVDGMNGSRAIAGGRHVWVGGSPPKRIDEVGQLTVVVSEFDGREVCRFTYSGQTFMPYHELASPTWMTQAAVSPDGKSMVVWDDNGKTLRAHSLGTGKQLHAQNVKTEFPGIHIAADGKTVLFQEYTKPIRRCELLTGKELPALGMPMPMSAWIETTADGKVAVIRDRYITHDNPERKPDLKKRQLTVWDLPGNKEAGVLELSGTPLHYKCVGADALLAVAGDYRTDGLPRYTVSRWNLATRKKDWEVPCPFADWLAVSPDGKRFVITDRSHVAHLYDAATGRRTAPLASHAGRVTWVGFSPDGGTVTTADTSDVRTWAPDGKPTGVVTAPKLGHGPPASDVLGECLVWPIPGDDPKSNELVGWDRAKSAIGWRMPLEGTVPDRVYSHDGKRVVGSTWDAKAKRWDVAVYDGPAGKKLHAWAMSELEVGNKPWPVAFRADGKLLYVGCQAGVVGYDAATGKERCRVETGDIPGDDLHKPSPLATTADGSRIAIVTQDGDRKFLVRAFETQSGRKLASHTLDLSPEHNGGAWYGMGVKFSPDGKRLAVCAGPGNTVALCDAESDAKPHVIDSGMSRPTCSAFSPNGATLAVGYADGTTLLWDVPAK